MTTPRFTAKMIGGDYQLVRDDAGHKVNRSLLTVLGAGVLVSGLTRHSSLGVVLSALGGGLLYAGLTGRNPCTALMRAIESVGESPEGPSHQHGRRVQRMQSPQDRVEEASMASFPASDAPAHSVQHDGARAK